MVPRRVDSFSNMMYSFSIERIKEHLLEFKSSISSHYKELWPYRVLPIPGPIPYVSKYLNRLSFLLLFAFIKES